MQLSGIFDVECNTSRGEIFSQRCKGRLLVASWVFHCRHIHKLQIRTIRHSNLAELHQIDELQCNDRQTTNLEPESIGAGIPLIIIIVYLIEISEVWFL